VIATRQRADIAVRLHRNLLLEVGGQTGAQRQKAVTPVLRDDKIGWKAFVGLTGENDARIGPEPHAEKGGGRAAVAQSETTAPVPLSIGKVGNHRSQPLGHEDSSNLDAADRQQKERRQGESRGGCRVSMACSPRPAQAGGDSREQCRGVGSACIAHDEGIAGADRDAEHRKKGERTWLKQADEQKGKRYCDVSTEMATANIHAGEASDDTVIGREVEETGEDGALGHDRRGDEGQSRCHPGAQPNHRVAVRTHSRA